MKTIFLSYRINEKTPAFGKSLCFSREQMKNMENGDSCNTQLWKIPNHIGTHIDAPNHFSRKGRTIDLYPPEFWCCNSVQYIQISSVKPNEIITKAHFLDKKMRDFSQLLLIGTGFGKCRDSEHYVLKNPGFDPGLAEYFREKIPSLKMIGLDVISLSGFNHRALGREAHKAFLDHETPILVIEDMDFSEISIDTKIHRVNVVPLRVERTDASPCTIIAECE